jgi:hypothetical protein
MNLGTSVETAIDTEYTETQRARRKIADHPPGKSSLSPNPPCSLWIFLCTLCQKRFLV